MSQIFRIFLLYVYEKLIYLQRYLQKDIRGHITDYSFIHINNLMFLKN